MVASPSRDLRSTDAPTAGRRLARRPRLVAGSYREPGALDPMGPDDTPARRPSRRGRPRLVLTATGSAVLATLAVSLVAIFDAAITPGLGLLFGIAFVVTSVQVARRVCWRDAWAAVALPPLVFAASAGIASQVAPESGGTWLERTSTDIASAVVGQPLMLLTGTALAIAVIAYRAYVD